MEQSSARSPAIYPWATRRRFRPYCTWSDGTGELEVPWGQQHHQHLFGDFFSRHFFSFFLWPRHHPPGVVLSGALGCFGRTGSGSGPTASQFHRTETDETRRPLTETAVVWLHGQHRRLPFSAVLGRRNRGPLASTSLFLVDRSKTRFTAKTLFSRRTDCKVAQGP